MKTRKETAIEARKAIAEAMAMHPHLTALEWFQIFNSILVPMLASLDPQHNPEGDRPSTHLTIRELRKLAKDQGIKAYGSMTKAELIQALKSP